MTQWVGDSAVRHGEALFGTILRHGWLEILECLNECCWLD